MSARTARAARTAPPGGEHGGGAEAHGSGTRRPGASTAGSGLAALLVAAGLALGATAVRAEGSASTVGLPPDPAAAAGAFCNGPGCPGESRDPIGHAAGFGAAALGAAWIARRIPVRRSPRPANPGRGAPA